MTMEFTQIRKSLWNESWFTKLSSQKKALVFYLLTNLSVNYLGCSRLHPEMIASEIRIKSDKIKTYLKELEAQGIIARSEDKEWWIFVRKFFQITGGNVASRRTVKQLEKNGVVLPDGLREIVKEELIESFKKRDIEVGDEEDHKEPEEEEDEHEYDEPEEEEEDDEGKDEFGFPR